MPSVRLQHRTNRPGSVFVFCLTFVLGVVTVHANEELSSLCQGAQNCGECILVNPECTWCTEDTFEGRRCDLDSLLLEAGCSNIANPLASVNATQNDPLSEVNADLDAIVQVKPQRMKIKVRPREPIDIRLYVRQAEDYPVDFYYVMDLSHSMKDDLENLKGLGTTLSKVLNNITRNFRLGFGSFVDKTVLPYVSTLPHRLISPCIGCASPHGFHNALPLNQDPTLFHNRIANTAVSGNLDTPEGGFDALMQIAVCGNIIGWRPKARHLVIFTTDNTFHIAGDGRLGGIVEPNDGQCHMDPNTNMYTFSTLQDYPSIGHLSAKLRENNVIPIFAVTIDQAPLYRSLQNYIEGATVGALDEDSGNIVQLIRSNYDNITSQVRLTSTAPDDVTLSYRANCKDQIYEDTNKCSGLKLGDTVSFDITITAERCVEGGMMSFNIGPVGFNEELKIELEVTCECDCQGLGEANSTVCSSGSGTLVCGECACNTGRYGVKCECSGNETNLESADLSPCRTNNTTRTCSGRGECICGKCVCDNTWSNFQNPGEIIWGQFCECDNFNCPYSRELRCGGPDRGRCVCDVATRQPKCQCNPGFKGDSCDCPTRKDTCRSSNGLECNAHGTCVCGVCECFTDSQFQGETCEKCPTCPFGICLIHRDCVQCTLFRSGRLTPEQCGMCSIDIINVPSIEEYTKDKPKCDFSLSGVCFVQFVVVSENGTVKVYVEGEETCITTDTKWIIIRIILGIVLIGMILVCAWKLYTYIQDEREYAQWKKDCKKPQWLPLSEAAILDAQRNLTEEQHATVEAYCHWIDEFLVKFKESRNSEAVTSIDDWKILDMIYHLKTGDAKSAIIKYLVSHDEIFEIFRLVWKSLVKGNFSTFLNSEELLALSVSISNLTDCSDEFCYAFGEKGLLPVVFRDLQTRNLGDSHISLALTTIYNCCWRVPENRVICREFVDTLHEYQSKNPEIQAVTFLALSYIVDKSEVHKISTNEPCLKFLMLALKSAMSEPDGRSRVYGYSTLKVLQGLNQLAINDCNKLLIVKLGGVDVLERILMQEGSNDEEKLWAARGIWQLAFKEENKVEIHQRTSLRNTLKRIKETTENSDVKDDCSGALFVINDVFDIDDELKGHTPTHGNRGHSSLKTEVSSDHVEGHIMISYQHASQERVLRIKHYLEECGYNVWMDVDKMKGDILDSMAKAVQRASVVLVCVSRKFKESQHCRTEATYAYNQKKDIIPLMLQDQFVPKDWLGALMGMKKYYPMFSDDHMKQCLPDLVRELGDKGKPVKLGASNPTTHAQRQWDETAVDEVDCSGGMVTWDEEEAVEWLRSNGVDTSMW